MSHRHTTSKILSRAKELRHNQTDTEAKLWTYLRAHRLTRFSFRRQHGIGSDIVDFCAPRAKLAIELDGSQHLDRHEYDNERTAFLEAQGSSVLRFWNNEVLNDIEGVARAILLQLQE